MIDTLRVPIKRVKDILRTHAYTPEWKVRELISILNLFSVCLLSIQTLFNTLRCQSAHSSMHTFALFSRILLGITILSTSKQRSEIMMVY